MVEPVLYSFRRCPYAIRARIALYYSGVVCELREVVLKSKPEHMLSVSPKGTVPVLLAPSDNEQGFDLIDESIDVIAWALRESKDPDNWLIHSCDDELIQRCDNEFKYWLDRYKYADRYPEFDAHFYFEKACVFLTQLEERLVSSSGTKKQASEACHEPQAFFIDSATVSVLDIAIFPFVRQFAFVDKNKFDALNVPKLQSWLTYFLASPIFLSVMQKYPMWVQDQTDKVVFGQLSNPEAQK